MSVLFSGHWGEANIQQQQKSGRFFVGAFQAGRRGEKELQMENKVVFNFGFHLNQAE